VQRSLLAELQNQLRMDVAQFSKMVTFAKVPLDIIPPVIIFLDKILRTESFRKCKTEKLKVVFLLNVFECFMFRAALV